MDVVKIVETFFEKLSEDEAAMRMVVSRLEKERMKKVAEWRGQVESEFYPVVFELFNDYVVKALEENCGDFDDQLKRIMILSHAARAARRAAESSAEKARLDAMKGR